MIFIQLFYTFLLIGIFGFGGGYGMLSLIQTETVVRHSWLSSAEFTNIVAISQMTPGPIGINSATYCGYAAVKNAGYGELTAILGSATATFALVLPSLVLMILISKLFMKYMDAPVVRSVFAALRPVVVGLLAAATLLLCNSENFSSPEVSIWQFAVSLLLEVCSHIGEHNRSVHEGEWASNVDWCYWHYPMIEVSGKTAGIIGLGRIGVNTAKILKAMNVRVIAYDAFQTEAGKAAAEYVELDELFRQSDFIFLHCPLFPSTEGIINRKNIEKMKDGVILINNSRGGLVVEQDLADALNSGKIAAAAVDVVSTEPIKPDNVLLTAKNCMITPHISWATREARERIMQTTADNIKSVIDGNPVNVINA